MRLLIAPTQGSFLRSRGRRPFAMSGHRSIIIGDDLKQISISKTFYEQGTLCGVEPFSKIGVPSPGGYPASIGQNTLVPLPYLHRLPRSDPTGSNTASAGLLLIAPPPSLVKRRCPAMLLPCLAVCPEQETISLPMQPDIPCLAVSVLCHIQEHRLFSLSISVHQHHKICILLDCA